MLKGDCGDPHEHMALRRPYQGILSLRNGDSPLQKLTGPGPQKPKKPAHERLPSWLDQRGGVLTTGSSKWKAGRGTGSVKWQEAGRLVERLIDVFKVLSF